MRGGANVEDSRIIELFNSRDEAAITETERKYGAYCRCVALNLLGVHEDAGRVRKRRAARGLERHTAGIPCLAQGLSRPHHAQHLCQPLAARPRQETL